MIHVRLQNSSQPPLAKIHNICRNKWCKAPGKQTNAGLLGCTQSMLAYDPEIDSMFAHRLGPADQLLAVLDLRSIDEATILGKARRLRHRR
jgi:hypothetical protein